MSSESKGAACFSVLWKQGGSVSQCLVKARGQRVSVSSESKGAACFSVF